MNLDAIFNAFISTNVFRGKNYTLKDICDNLNPGPCRSLMKYEYQKRFYLAEVFIKHNYDGDWMVVELVAPDGVSCPKYPKDIIDALSHLGEGVSKVFYYEKSRRIDICWFGDTLVCVIFKHKYADEEPDVCF